LHSAVTTSPTAESTAQQLREATPWGRGPKYLLHDRDSKYASHFSAVATGSGIQELRTPYRAPRANGICERYMGNLRSECLNHALILNDRHLLRVVKEYTKYFNQERPHQGIGQRIPNHYDRPVSRYYFDFLKTTDRQLVIIKKPFKVGPVNGQGLILTIFHPKIPKYQMDVSSSQDTRPLHPRAFRAPGLVAGFLPLRSIP